MNEKIQQARDVALSVLNPSARDLEHGLELHANALVCDAYGFAPRAAWDGEAMRNAVESGASEAELKDMEEEMSMTRCVSDPRERAEFIEAWEASGVTCIFQNAGEESQAPLRILHRLSRFTHVGDTLREFLVRATLPDDILAARQQNKRCFYMSSNGVPLTQAWSTLEEELSFIRVFFQLGVRMMHLTYNRRNMLGDGCAEPSDGGLSDLGRAAIREMNRVGVIVDVAHAGWRTSLEAAQASDHPMVASHSGCCALTTHIRCKPDEVIRAIVDTGGYIGICCIPDFLGRTGDILALLDHVDHVAQTFGVDHVAIGTDTAYTSRNMEVERQKVPRRRRVRNRWEGFWPPDAFDAKWRQERMLLSLSWTNWPMFTVGLVQRGYTDDDIRKILGDNALRVARAVLPESL